MVRRKDTDSEIREASVPYDAGRPAVPLPAAPEQPGRDSPWFYGFRPVWTRDADGREVLRDVPLTIEDYLHPREGDLMTQGNPHQRLVRRLADVIQRWLEKTPGIGVFSDVLVRWGVDDLPAQAPDVAVVRGVFDPEKVAGSVDCADPGVEPELAIEVVSTTHREYREKDLHDKVRIYERGGVREYVIVDPTGREPGPFRLIGYRLDAAGRYREIAPGEDAAILSETTGLRFVPDAERGVVLEVAATGERLLFADEVAEALQAAEAARREAERRAAEAEEKLARLLAEAGGR